MALMVFCDARNVDRNYMSDICMSDISKSDICMNDVCMNDISTSDICMSDISCFVHKPSNIVCAQTRSSLAHGVGVNKTDFAHQLTSYLQRVADIDSLPSATIITVIVMFEERSKGRSRHHWGSFIPRRCRKSVEQSAAFDMRSSPPSLQMVLYNSSFCQH